MGLENEPSVFRPNLFPPDALRDILINPSGPSKPGSRQNTLSKIEVIRGVVHKWIRNTKPQPTNEIAEPVTLILVDMSQPVVNHKEHVIKPEEPKPLS